MGAQLIFTKTSDRPDRKGFAVSRGQHNIARIEGFLGDYYNEQKKEYEPAWKWYIHDNSPCVFPAVGPLASKEECFAYFNTQLQF